MTTETSFSYNFDAGTLTDAIVKSIEENAAQGRSGYGLPLAACLPGTDEPNLASERPNNQQIPVQPSTERDGVRDISERVFHY